MRRLVAVWVLAAFSLNTALVLALDGKKAQYMGGTISSVKEGAEGTLDTANDTTLRFTANKNPTIEIPYASISELEYGQKAGRRVGVAIMISPIALFSKKRKHFLTVSYKDAAGKD